MAIQGSQSQQMLVFCLIVLLISSPSSRSGGVVASHDFASNSTNRSSFPAGFLFGTASSSFQYEGAAKEGGKGPSIWDTFTHRYPDRIKDGSNGDVAIDFYHRYKDDVDMMKEIGMDAFRLSISWPRLLPNGKLSGGVNKEGIRFYNSLIDELLSNGIQPFVTLFHWDLPQALEDDYGGFLSSKIIEDFRDYSELCFKEFGDRVKHWITFNEPSIFSNQGYSLGRYAPGRCSRWVNSKCSAGNSATEPYVVGHNQLLAHAATVKLYKEEYQAAQKGKIGITLVCHWMVPFSNEKRNVAAAQRAIDFTYGWFMDPLAHGDYPKSMRSLVGTRLPRFTIKQSALVKGSFDFLGLNYYTGFYAADAAPSNNTVNISYNTDYHVNTFTQRNGTPIGPKTAVSWLSVYPRGIHDLLIYTKTRYKNPVIYITENGIPEPNKITLIMEEALKDDVRINYHSRHFQFLLRAIKEGVDVRGYFAWSLFDHFDWALGYTLRYGIEYVDYKDRLERYPKRSAIWFKSFLKSYNKM